MTELLEHEAVAAQEPTTTTKKTFIVFSGELDRVLAAFVLANAAAAMDDDVTMFFTFWGLNVLRRPDKPARTEKKTPLQAMFGMMMPRGSRKLALSHMNFGGAGPKLMRRAMRQQGVASLEEMVASAREQGVHMVACLMSMDVMGIKKEELIDDLEFAGAATYLAAADKANVNLFI